jgi:DNA-binding SARP family transcriptional activator
VGNLTLRLFGVPEIRLDSRLLHFPTRKAQALLIYLVVEGGLHSRASLTTLFWSESSTKLARASFRNTLARLQRTLDDPALLLVEGDLIGLRNDKTIQSDVYDVTKLTAHSSNIHELTLQSVLNGMSGDFLEGFTLDDSIGFDDWVSLKREYYHHLIDQMLDGLSQRSFDGNRVAYHELLKITLAWIKHNPLSERAYHRLIELYLETGDRSSALRAYQNYYATLTTQLGLEPSTEIQALIGSLQSETKRASALNAQQLNALKTAVALIANDAVFINPSGYYAGKDMIYRHLKQLVSRCIQFQIWNFRVIGCCVIYSYQVRLNSFLVLDAFEDGATIIRNGKIIFDGTLRSAPSDLLALAYSSVLERHAVEVVKTYYRALNAEIFP